MTRSGVSIEYFESWVSCLYVYLDLLSKGGGCDTESAIVVVITHDAGTEGDAMG